MARKALPAVKLSLFVAMAIFSSVVGARSLRDYVAYDNGDAEDVNNPPTLFETKEGELAPLWYWTWFKTNTEPRNPKALIGCSGYDMSPTKNMTIHECVRACSEEFGCSTVFYEYDTEKCTFLANTFDDPVIRSEKNATVAVCVGCVEDGPRPAYEDCSWNATIPRS